MALAEACGVTERTYTVDECRELLRALRIERSIRKLCERRLRELLTRNAYEEFKKFSQGESLATSDWLIGRPPAQNASGQMCVSLNGSVRTGGSR